MRIGLLSDTHGWLDPAVFDYFQECDEIWHAGDIGTEAVLDELAAFRPVRAVFGNVDGARLRQRCPETLVFTTAGVKVVLLHIGGRPPGYAQGVKRFLQLHRPAVFVCGHSHLLLVQRDANLGNLLHLNPGAAGRHGFHKVRTLLRFSLGNGKISNLEAIELGPRTEGKPKDVPPLS